MIKTIKVSDKGQISIPQNFRESLGIVKGDDLTIFQINGKILIEKSQKTEENQETRSMASRFPDPEPSKNQNLF